MKMRKLWMLSAVVLLLFAGVAAGKNPQAQPSSASAAQADATKPAQASAAPMQTFTSSDGRFSILFPGAPQQKSQVVALKNGESTTIYQFYAEADNSNTSYIVMYNDYSAAVVGGSPQALLERTRDGAVAGKTLLTDVVIDLNGVPGRAYTAVDPDGYNYEVHEYLAGTRFYQLIITTSKGFTATQAGAFMNSFRIL
jgi:hypothetical protein